MPPKGSSQRSALLVVIAVTWRPAFRRYFGTVGLA